MDGSVTYSHDTENRLTAASGASTASLLYDLFGCLVRIDDGNFNIAGVRAIVDIVLKFVKMTWVMPYLSSFWGTAFPQVLAISIPKGAKSETCNSISCRTFSSFYSIHSANDYGGS